jgi:hypothetical protein
MTTTSQANGWAEAFDEMFEDSEEDELNSDDFTEFVEREVTEQETAFLTYSSTNPPNLNPRQNPLQILQPPSFQTPPNTTRPNPVELVSPFSRRNRGNTANSPSSTTPRVTATPQGNESIWSNRTWVLVMFSFGAVLLLRLLDNFVGSSMKLILAVIISLFVSMRFLTVVQRRTHNYRDYGSGYQHRLQLISQLIDSQTYGGLINPHLRLALIDRDFNENDYEALLALDEDTPTHRCRAASSEVISQLPISSFTRQDLSIGKCCPICLENYEIGDPIKTMPCSHKFHSKCLAQWLGVQATCPICKFSLK